MEWKGGKNNVKDYDKLGTNDTHPKHSLVYAKSPQPS
jgi:hypothetical protein